jgi:ABC-type Fe3+-hydroxamate transport system substrate-binding protein
VSPGRVRVVSLVPSVTETLLALGITPVACTRFCEQPGLVHVGGTKDPRLEEIAALAPDLVVVNDEENRIEDVEGLRELGLRLHEMSPRSVAGVGPAVAALAAVVSVRVPSPFGTEEWRAWLAGVERRRLVGAPQPVFVAVWRRPWMTLSADTYGSSLLDLLGWQNVFAGEDERYPEVTLDQVSARHPETVLLPSEPYPFRERHVAEISAALPDAKVALVDGQDLFWWGIRTPAAVERLAAALG